MQRRGIHDLHRDQLLFRFRYLRSTGIPLHVPVERIRRYLVASTELLSRQTTRFKIADQLFSFAPATVPPKSCCTHSFRHASSSRPIPAQSRCTSPDAYIALAPACHTTEGRIAEFGGAFQFLELGRLAIRADHGAKVTPSG